MLTYSEQALRLIRRFEGCSLQPYICPAGKHTIGYGHVIRINDHIPPGGISLEQAEQFLAQDAMRAALGVERYAVGALTQNQFDALVSFVFNIGVGAFSRSTLVKMINRGWHIEAAKEMARWVYADGRKLPGLVERRSAEIALYKAEEGDLEDI